MIDYRSKVTIVMETIGTRVKARREELGWSQGTLAEKAGVSQGTIGNLESGIRKKPREWLAIAVALGLNPVFLETGKGERLAEDEYKPAKVRRIHQRLSAGHGHAVYHEAKESWLAFQHQFLRKIGVSEKNAAIFDVSGPSMEPELHDGAVVLINMNVRYDAILDGKHYAFICGDECLVKTLYKMPGGTVRAMSQNPDKEEFPDKLIDPSKERFELLGLVLWEGRTI